MNTTIFPAQPGRAVSVSRGGLVRVVDVEGHQVGDMVGDMWAVDATDRRRWLSVGQNVQIRNGAAPDQTRAPGRPYRRLGERSA